MPRERAAASRLAATARSKARMQMLLARQTTINVELLISERNDEGERLTVTGVRHDLRPFFSGCFAFFLASAGEATTAIKRTATPRPVVPAHAALWASASYLSFSYTPHLLAYRE